MREVLDSGSPPSAQLQPSPTCLHGSDMAWLETLQAWENSASKHLRRSALPLEVSRACSGIPRGAWQSHHACSAFQSLYNSPSLVANEEGLGSQMAKGLFLSQEGLGVGSWVLEPHWIRMSLDWSTGGRDENSHWPKWIFEGRAAV